MLNVNGDDAAAAIAVALRRRGAAARRGCPGRSDAQGERGPELDVETRVALIAAGTARGGMAAKLQAARARARRVACRVFGSATSRRSSSPRRAP